MFRNSLTAVALAGMLAFGCDNKTEAEKKADDAGKAASNQIGEIKDKAGDAKSEVKKEADANADKMKEGASAINDEIKSLADKAQTAVKDRKWEDAENYLKQIDELKNKLPEGARSEIDTMIASTRKMIDTGKAMPAMPK